MRLKVSDTEAVLSLAVTLTAMVPTSELVGVPVKVRVEALKDSQEGRDDPLDKVAVGQRSSTIDIGERIDGFTTERRIFCRGLIGNSIGNRWRVIHL